jgi:hypothetical protein
MELPPQALTGADEPVAGPEKGQSQSDENQIAHGIAPPVLFLYFYSNHLRVNSISKILPAASRRRQFGGEI